jgi:hypothetical protein
MKDDEALWQTWWAELTGEQRYQAIGEAIQSLAREGRIYDTGRRRWCDRTKSYQIVWAVVPGANLENLEAGPLH